MATGNKVDARVGYKILPGSVVGYSDPMPGSVCIGDSQDVDGVELCPGSVYERPKAP